MTGSAKPARCRRAPSGAELGEGRDPRRGAAGQLRLRPRQSSRAARSASRRREARPGTGRRASARGGSARARRAGRRPTGGQAPRRRGRGSPARRAAAPRRRRRRCAAATARRSMRTTRLDLAGRRRAGRRAAGSGLPISTASGKVPLDRRQPLDQVVGDARASRKSAPRPRAARRAPATRGRGARGRRCAIGPVMARCYGRSPAPRQRPLAGWRRAASWRRASSSRPDAQAGGCGAIPTLDEPPPTGSGLPAPACGRCGARPASTSRCRRIASPATRPVASDGTLCAGLLVGSCG